MQFKYIRLLILFFISNLIFTSYSAQNKSIIINEVLASNEKIFFDGFGEFQDWIELYNPSDSSISLKDMYITNDLANPLKHCLSLEVNYWMTIQPNSYLILWLDNDPEQGKRHLPFKLKKKEGVIALYDKDINEIDRLEYKLQETDVSIGRININDPNLYLFEEPTPNKQNRNGLILTPDSVQVSVNKPSGFYKDSIFVKLTANRQGDIYYTLDGSEPSIKNNKYITPIKIDSTVVLRSAVIIEGFTNPKIQTNSYFINEEHSLSVLSLTSDPKNLWNKKKGIYKNSHKVGIEKQAIVEYFERQSDSEFKFAFSKSVDIRIAGKTSRRQAKKSFAIFLNNIDGEDKINFKLFKDKPINNFSSFWVRADATSGINVSDLYVGERFKNELIYEINQEMNGNVDMQAYEPILLYLNGKYWGIYNLMERKGNNFIANNHNEINVDILTAETTKIVKGKMDHYVNMLDYVRMNDMSKDSAYSHICSLIDINSYIDYWIYETYCGAHDINVNIRYWKAQKKGTKWRWISYDQDSWNSFDEKALDYYLNHGRVFLLSRLMKNINFRNQFINRMCDYLNSGFKAENIIKLVDQITNRIEKEMPRDRNRWEKEMLYAKKNERINWIKEYAVKRPSYIYNEMISIFEIDGNKIKVKLNSEKLSGTIKINSLITKKGKWQGNYIENIPITIKAIPDDGYDFVKWKQRKLPKDDTIIINPKKYNQFTPIFKKK